MKVSRVATGLTAVVSATLGLGLATAGPASADAGAWKAYGNTNPITSSPNVWVCGPTKGFDTNVLAQACVERPVSGTSARAAVIVRNNRSSLYGVEVAETLNDWSDDHSLGRWVCGHSGVGANSWSVCFGQPVNAGSPVYVRDAGANGQTLPSSGRSA